MMKINHLARVQSTKGKREMEESIHWSGLKLYQLIIYWNLMVSKKKLYKNYLKKLMKVFKRIIEMLIKKLMRKRILYKVNI